MTLQNLRCFSPRSIEEALNLIHAYDEAVFMGGGTDLLVDLKEELLESGCVIALGNIPGLQGIRRERDWIRIGSCVTPAEIIVDPLIGQEFPALAEAAATMASFQIRSMATIGGNIVSAVPSADLPPILIAAGAKVELTCRLETRIVPLVEFFIGPKITVCREEEILTCVLLPDLPPQTGLYYQKFSLRNGNALAVAGSAVRLTLMDGVIQSAAIVLGAVAPNPLFAEEASAFLNGKTPDPSYFEEAARIARQEARPISDMRGSEWHRRELVEILTLRALNEACARAGGNVSEEEEPA